MTKVELAQNKVNDLKSEIEGFEQDISYNEFKIENLECETEDMREEIGELELKLELAEYELSEAEAEYKPMNGQLCFMDTGYINTVNINVTVNLQSNK